MLQSLDRLNPRATIRANNSIRLHQLLSDFGVCVHGVSGLKRADVLIKSTETRTSVQELIVMLDLRLNVDEERLKWPRRNRGQVCVCENICACISWYTKYKKDTRTKALDSFDLVRIFG